MTLEDACKLSFYRQLAPLGENDTVELVQHVQTKQLFVRKTRSVYRRDIYEHLQKHPVSGLPKIAELAEDDGRLIVIEQYISGENLQTLLQREKVLSPERVKSIAVQLCTIVQKLHLQSPPIIHRDIKPSNILLSSDGRVWLLDLNAAKPDEKKQYRDTQLIGTVGYAAPEQYGFGSSCVQTDVYAIGILLSVLLTGKLPPEGRLPSPWAGIVKKCTQMDPKDRYADAQELLAAIRRIGNEEVAEKPSILPPGFRSKKPLPMLLSAGGYALLSWFCFTLELKDSTPRMLWVYRVGVFVIFFVAILFWGDYRNMQQQLHLHKIKNPVFRIALAALIGMAIIMLGIIFLIPIEMLIK